MKTLAAITALGIAAVPSLASAQDVTIHGAQAPALSPDGKRVAFSWRGDVYIAAASGGTASPLTAHAEFDGNPVFSPDGKWIAFSSNRNGNSDIFIVPSTGGTPRRVTKSPASEVPTDWTPDSKSIYFSANRESNVPGIYTVNVDSLKVQRIVEDFKRIGGAAPLAGGKQLVYTRDGFPWTRPRYRGSAASQLWRFDIASKKRTAITSGEQQYLWPRPTPDGKSVICVTTGEETPNAQWFGKAPLKWTDNADKTPNVWSIPVDGGKPQRLTSLTGGSVRYPSLAAKTGDIVFAHGKDIYIRPATGGDPRKLMLIAGTADDKTNPISRWSISNNQVSEQEPSPDGKQVAFLVNNDIWVAPIDKGKGRNVDLAERITDWIGYDRDFVWTPDGKQILFVSDRDGNDKLYSVDVASKRVTPLWTKPEAVSAPKLTPDGKRVSFWVGGSRDVAGLYTALLDGTDTKKVAAVPSAHQGFSSFSPDGRFVAYSRESTITGNPDIYIAPLDASKPAENVTRLASFHGQMSWSPDGRFLFFASNRDGDGLYALPLQPVDVRADDGETTIGKLENVKIEIDFTDIQTRIRQIVPGSASDISVLKDGRVLFIGNGDVTTCAFDGKNVTKVTGGGGTGMLRLAADEKSATYLRGGQIFAIKGIAPGTPQPLVTFTASGETDINQLRAVAFTQFWRSYQTRFYDPNFHGRDWVALRDAYRPLLGGVGTREEFATVLNMLAGELEASHAEVGPAASPIASTGVKHLGVTFDEAYDGPGIKIRTVPPRTPGSYAKTKLSPGEFIVAIDGKDCSVDENLWDILQDRGDRDVTLLVNSKPVRDGARTVTFRALSMGDWSNINYRNKIDTRRKQVESASGGRIGYVHIAGMGGDNQNTFEKEFFSWAEGKDAMVIDVRENGGGNIGDRLISWLGNKPYSTYVPRDGDPKSGPPDWAARTFPKIPIVVLMGENSFSNAEMFPYGMRATGLATLIGKPTPGYVIWTWGLPLIDGTSARMPGAGTYRKDGSPMENLGEKPDIDVEWPAEDYLAGRDPQLERAIKELLAKSGK